MFRRRQTQLNQVSLQDLAGRLGIETRRVLRARYPERLPAGLPRLSYLGHPLRGHDIGVGGCALIDSHHVLSTLAGQEVELELHFADGIDLVQCRVVTLVTDRAHIQFKNLTLARQRDLNALITFANRGAHLRRSPGSSFEGPKLSAREIWSSPQGDALIFESPAEHTAEAHAEILGKHYVFNALTWPSDQRGQVVDREQMHALILYLANVPKPSAAMAKLQLGLEQRLGGRP